MTVADLQVNLSECAMAGPVAGQGGPSCRVGSAAAGRQAHSGGMLPNRPRYRCAVLPCGRLVVPQALLPATARPCSGVLPCTLPDATPSRSPAPTSNPSRRHASEQGAHPPRFCCPQPLDAAPAVGRGGAVRAARAGAPVPVRGAQAVGLGHACRGAFQASRAAPTTVVRNSGVGAKPPTLQAVSA